MATRTPVKRRHTDLQIEVDLQRPDILTALPNAVMARMMTYGHADKVPKYMKQILGYLESTDQEYWSLDRVLEIIDEWVEIVPTEFVYDMSDAEDVLDEDDHERWMGERDLPPPWYRKAKTGLVLALGPGWDTDPHLIYRKMVSAFKAAPEYAGDGLEYLEDVQRLLNSYRPTVGEFAELAQKYITIRTDHTR